MTRETLSILLLLGSLYALVLVVVATGEWLRTRGQRHRQAVLLTADVDRARVMADYYVHSRGAEI